jgi:hypothetical protein
MKIMGWIAALLLTCSIAQAAETLVVPPYPASAPWKKITDAHNAQQMMIEWIPADQNENAIGDILTEQAFYGSPLAPDAFVARFLSGVGGACRDARVNGPKMGTENGFPVAYAQAYCAGQKGANKDVDIFLKAIRGHDALYVVQREFRRPATPGAVAGVAPFANKEQAQQRLAAQAAANHFLVAQVRLTPDRQANRH